jgi:signal transduction histidine kinase
VGWLIVSRSARNAIGWALLWIGTGIAVLNGTSWYAAHALLYAPGSLPFGMLTAWLQYWLPVPVITAMIFVFLLFPTGRVPGPRWRWILWLAVGATVVLTLAWGVNPGPLGQTVGSSGELGTDNPLGVGRDGGPVDVVITIAALASLLAGVLAAVSMVVRYRRSSGTERQQIRWLALVGALALTIFLIQFLVALACGETEVGVCGKLGELGFTAFLTVLLFGIPLACGIAVFGYRLWDLDVVVKKGVTALILAGLILAAAVATVAGVAAVSISNAGVTTSLIVGIVLGLAFRPLLGWSRRVADRLVFGRRATPYEVLTSFSSRVGETYATEEILPRMAEILARGTGAKAASVWVRVGDELRQGGSWPDSSDGPAGLRISGQVLPAIDREVTFEVRHQEELLGILSLDMHASDPMNPAKERLARDLAGQAGLVLRNVRLIEELRASRQRLVRAQDEERRRLERNLHDGAQQQLVSLAVQLRLAEQLVGGDPERERELLRGLQGQATEAIEDLRDLARGIYPPLLADKGLVIALEGQIRKGAVPVEVRAEGTGRYTQEVEATVYFCCLEALQNVAKYASGSSATVQLVETGGSLAFTVTDHGPGFDPSATSYGTGLQGMADRVAAIGGVLTVRSAPGEGTIVSGIVPTGARQEPSSTGARP